MYNYEARDSQDVSFKKGDRMEVTDDSEGDWLHVVHLITKERGYIPGNFVAPELSVESEEWVFLFAYLLQLFLNITWLKEVFHKVHFKVVISINLFQVAYCSKTNLNLALMTSVNS